ncbi:MAG: hypothetical protein NZM65_00710 [Flavobacteriales bacterium]|nr:hypothetical protein [Flavobacteriales bacterium]MDW8409189.1 hypothetical protein [Flavobacteriales bacterium]
MISNFSAFGQNQSLSGVTSAEPPKELMKESDPFHVAYYNTDEKVLLLEARIKEIKRNLEVNATNPNYDRTTMQDILARLEAVYQELRRSGKYPFLDKGK